MRRCSPGQFLDDRLAGNPWRSVVFAARDCRRSREGQRRVSAGRGDDRKPPTVRHHVKKIAFLFSAMRHYAEALRSEGHAVRYVNLDDDGNCQSLEGEILRAVEALSPHRIAITEPGEWRLREVFEGLRDALQIPLEILPDTRFLCSHSEQFGEWAEGRQELRMEYFYREMRRRHDILMEPGGKPAGGRWNFDLKTESRPRKGSTRRGGSVFARTPSRGMCLIWCGGDFPTAMAGWNHSISPSPVNRRC